MTTTVDTPTVCGWCGRQLRRLACCWERERLDDRPPIDLDLGAALQYGYRWPQVRVVEGPPELLDRWPSVPAVRAAVAGLLADGEAWTAVALGSHLELDSRQRAQYLYPALSSLVAAGRLVRTPRSASSRRDVWQIVGVV